MLCEVIGFMLCEVVLIYICCGCLYGCLVVFLVSSVLLDGEGVCDWLVGYCCDCMVVIIVCL